PDESWADGALSPTKSRRDRIAQEDLVGQRNRSRSLYPTAFHHDRGRHLAGPGPDRPLRSVRSETAEEPAPHHQRRDHARAGGRDFPRIDRETSASVRPSFHQHGESG